MKNRRNGRKGNRSRNRRRMSRSNNRRRMKRMNSRRNSGEVKGWRKRNIMCVIIMNELIFELSILNDHGLNLFSRYGLNFFSRQHHRMQICHGEK